MKFVKFEDREAYGPNDIGILCDYEPILIDEERAQTDWEAVRIGDNWYSDQHYLEDLSAYYDGDTNNGVVWWESRFYYDQNRVVVLDTVDINTYMFDLRHGSQVFRRPM